MDIEDPIWRWSIDLACATGHWEDENYQYDKSKEDAKEESEVIGSKLEDYRHKLRDGRRK